MTNAVCEDSRAHGMFQFYGANRTGRFSGKLIQLQNLPQNHIPDLKEARELVRERFYDSVETLYDNIPDILSQLIRTAFVPKNGCRFIVADFSAIEARVLSWIAGEQVEVLIMSKTLTVKVRKDLWDLFPQRRADFFEDISQTEIEEFVTLMDKQRKDDSDRIKHLTVNDFFSLCALGYKANNYEGTDLSPREQYYLHADGRDDDLGKINPDSVEEFRDWLLNKLKYGHPWEVCRGGNSTHISLYVGYDEAGFFLILAGSAWTRTIETVKFYLALINAGFPVYLRDGKILASRLLETERIGVVPDGVFPCYCEMLFPGEHIIDFMNLPYENREQVAEFCVWQDINPTELMDD